MSLFGSLFSAVSGLNAQSQAMAMIADNVSNVNTVSYKAADAQLRDPGHQLVGERRLQPRRRQGEHASIGSTSRA